MLTRRDALRMGLLGGSALALGKAGAAQMRAQQGGMGGMQGGMGCPGCMGGGMGQGGMGGGMMGGGMGMGGVVSPATVPFQVPLPLPAVLKPKTGRDAGTDYYEITAKAVKQQILPRPHPATEVYGYGGTFPGPTIVAKRGRPVQIRHANNLPDSMSVHLHGGHVSPENDGHPMDMVMPGMAKTYHYPNNQIASTLFYHDHLMDKTAEHVYMGLAGFYIITDEVEESLNLPDGEFDVGLAIQDRMFNADGSFHYPALTHHTIMRGVYGDKILVNGAIQPYMKVKRGKYRFRALNGSSARAYDLALSTGKPLVHIANETGLLPMAVERSHVPIFTGQRREVIVDFSAYTPGTKVVLRDLNGRGGASDIMRFDVTDAKGFSGTIPTRLRPCKKLDRKQAAETRDFVLGFDMMMGLWTINGMPYDMDRLDFTVARGSTEIWRFINNMGMMGMSHPMHPHFGAFQILDRNGVRPGPHDAGWQDTVAVGPGENVSIIMKFDDFVTAREIDYSTGKFPYMFHCHILEHDDHGMMAQFAIV